jgi:peptidoglycan/LPS O-acetylase OafA/YrhL
VNPDHSPEDANSRDSISEAHNAPLRILYVMAAVVLLVLFPLQCTSGLLQTASWPYDLHVWMLLAGMLIQPVAAACLFLGSRWGVALLVVAILLCHVAALFAIVFLGVEVLQYLNGRGVLARAKPRA